MNLDRGVIDSKHALLSVKETSAGACDAELPNPRPKARPSVARFRDLPYRRVTTQPHHVLTGVSRTAARIYFQNPDCVVHHRARSWALASLYRPYRGFPRHLLDASAVAARSVRVGTAPGGREAGIASAGVAVGSRQHRSGLTLANAGEHVAGAGRRRMDRALRSNGVAPGRPQSAGDASEALDGRAGAFQCESANRSAASVAARAECRAVGAVDLESSLLGCGEPGSGPAPGFTGDLPAKIWAPTARFGVEWPSLPQ